jgi:MFS transporter, FSR family, fosmidomycin resistance protein
VSFGLASAFGWRVALATIGADALVVLCVLWQQRRYLVSDRAAEGPVHSLRSVGLLLRPTILWCFAFFVLFTAAGVGLQTFLPASLNVGLSVPLVIATSAVTAFLLGGTAGNVAGGFLSARTDRHERVAAGGLLAAALLLVPVGAGWVPTTALIALVATVGFVVGATGPSRDLIVREATPKGASGRVYGFVYSGLDVGGTLAPLWFGLMLDHGLAREVFYVTALLYVVAIATVVNLRRWRTMPAAPA